MAGAAALAASLALAGCGLFGGGSSSTESAAAAPAAAPGTGCPAVLVVGDAAQMVRFRAGGGRAAADVVARGQILNVRGTCEYRAGGAAVEVTFDIAGERGPAATSQDIPLHYFVAILDPGRTIIAREAFDAGIRLPAGLTRAVGQGEQVAQWIPLSNPALGPSYQVLVGFELTPDQVEYNRRQ